MSQTTPIQWTDSTVNPTLGCDGCELWRWPNVKTCYAGRFTERFGKSNSGLADDFNIASEGPPGRIAVAARWSDLLGKQRAGKPWLDGLPRTIFVGDMADTFSTAISFEFLRREVIEAVQSDAGRRHQWQWLTKRPGRMAEFSQWLAERGVAWPENLWAGTSITTQATISRVDQLLHVGDDATLKFVSVEPQWGSIEFGDRLAKLGWIIQGGMSGSIDSPFDLAWADNLRAACSDVGTPYFLKQLGAHVVAGGQRIKFQDGHGGDWNQWPRRLRARQMPIHVGGKERARLRQRGCRLPSLHSA